MLEYHRSISVLCWGMVISFLGSLPLGTMNIVATQIAVSRGQGAALLYSSGSLLVELLYVSIVLSMMEKMFRSNKIFRILEWLTVGILLALAAASFLAAIRMKGFGDTLPVISGMPFLSGLILSAINPLHFVFWMGWSTVLIKKRILKVGFSPSFFYLIGISLGTIGGFACYIVGGPYLIARLKEGQTMINWIVGTILLVTAILSLYKLNERAQSSKKASVS